MKLKQITLDKDSQQRAQELTEKLYKVCAGESLPVAFVALSAAKAAVQGCSKVMTPEEVDDMAKRAAESTQKEGTI